MERLHDSCVALIHQDSFYKGLTPEQLEDAKSGCHAFTSFPPCQLPASAGAWSTPPAAAHAHRSACHCTPADYNFDHPDAFDQEALMQCLLQLKVRRSACGIPRCTRSSSSRHSGSGARTMAPAQLRLW